MRSTDSTVKTNNHHRDVVALKRIAGELLHLTNELFQNSFRILTVAIPHECDQGVVAKLFAAQVHRFGHAVAEGQQDIALLEHHLLLVEGCGFEESEYDTAGLETLNAVLLHENRRVMPGVCEDERAVLVQDPV